MPPPLRPRTRLAQAALLAGATAIGFAPLFVRLSEAGPSATAFYRILLAQPLLWTWVAWERRRPTPSRQPCGWREYLSLAVAGLFFAADMSLWHWSLRFTTVANSTLLTNVAPILVTIGAWAWFGERIHRSFVMGMVLALGGGALLVSQSVRISQEHLFGDVLSVVTAVFYAGYMLSVSFLRRKFSPATIMAWSGLVGVPVLGLTAWLSGEQLAPTSQKGWLAVLGLALVSHVGGQSLIAYAFGHLPASFTSVSLLWQPVVAALAAWMVLGEALTWPLVAGGAVVLLGIATASGSVGVWRRGRAGPKRGA